MSGGSIFQHVLRRVMALELCDAARVDVVAALEAAARKSTILQLLYEAAHEAGHDRRPLLDRCGGVFCAFAAGNLADDLVDGDCTYLTPAIRLGPTVQWLLQHLSVALLVEGGVTATDLGRMADLLARAAGPQQLEVRATVWTAALFLDVGEGIVGRQWQAYLVALWSGTALADEALALGMALGISGHVALDVRSLDRRFHSMSAPDQEHVLRIAREQLAVVEASPRRIASLIADNVRPALRTAAVAAYYDEKTKRILDRYGPGPRIHYHTGLFASPGAEAVGRLTQLELKHKLFTAQEALVNDSLAAWGLTQALAGVRVLDCGCGLGGPALLLASGGAQVTAVTVCAPHVEVTRDLALQAGVSDRVQVSCQAVEEIEWQGCFDCAIAIEASCYFDRPAFFARMARALVPGGQLLIVDLFAGRPDVKERFDSDWRTDLGTLAAYDEAAAAAGFRRTSVTDLSDGGAGFWDLTRADTRRLLATAIDEPTRDRLQRSLTAHEALERGARDGGLLHLRLAYQAPQ